MKKLGVTFESAQGAGIEKIKAAAPDYEVVFCKTSDEVITECEIIFGGINPKLLQQAKKLKWLHTFTAGVDYLLKPEVNFPQDVLLTNSAGTYGVAISEYLLTITLMLMRRNLQYAKLQFENTWKPLGSVKSVYGSKICVVGLGDIGENYAKRAQALGASVVGVVRSPREMLPDCVEKLYTIEQLDEAISDADVVALCLPGTNATAGMFDKERMEKMKDGAIILNIGRGSAIDTPALIEALQSGKLGGAGLDVTNPEPLPETSPLWQMENVVITPHISGNQSLALTNEMIIDKFLAYLEDYLSGREFEKVVDKALGY